MTNPTLALPLPAVPGDVFAFAAECGVAAFLPAVLEMTRRVFGSTAVRLTVTDDPEIGDFRHIVVEAETGSDDVERLLQLQQEWTTGLLRVCPSVHAIHFLLRVL